MLPHENGTGCWPVHYYTIISKCNSLTVVCPPVRGDNPRALARGLSPRTGGQPCYNYFYTTLINVDLAQKNEIARAKCELFKCGIKPFFSDFL